MLIPWMVQNNKSILVLDNARVHRRNVVNYMFTQMGMRVEWLPPYSPWFMPIEKLFLAIKMVCRGGAVNIHTVNRAAQSFTPAQMRGFCRCTGWY